MSSRILLTAATILLAAGVNVDHSRADDLTPGQKRALPTHFGFGPLEIFKIDDDIDQLRTADFNGDGLTDLAVINNSKSTIEVLLQRRTEADQNDEPLEINDLTNDWRFERKSVSVNWAVECLQTADLTGDGHTDLVFFGDPKEIVVLPGRGDGTFADALTKRVRDGVGLPSCLAVGDLNGDSRTDVALLAESDVLIFHQPETGGLGNPARFAHALDNPGALKLADLDGDGRTDLILINHEAEYPLLVRHQDARGNLGPVERMKLPGLRSLLLTDCLERKRSDLFGVEQASGRLKRWSLGPGAEAAQPASAREWAVRHYPIPGRSDAERLPLAVGDVDGDGRPDLVTADVDGARLVLFAQPGDDGLSPPQTFGGQIKMRDLRCYDTDGDGAAEAFIVSAEEELITVSRFRSSRLTFPKALPTTHKPFALDVAPLLAGGDPVLAYVARDSDSTYHLIVQPAGAGAADASRTQTVSLDELDEPPTAVRLVDVNRNGRRDVLIFSPYAPLMTLLQDDAGAFVMHGGKGGSQKGLVKQARIEGFAYADTDGDGKAEVLLAQKAFVRALCVNADGAWEILDQYNAPGADAEITGVTTLPMPGAERVFLAMYDRRGREVHFFAPGPDGTYTLDRSIQVGAFDLKAMSAAPLAGSPQPSVLLADARRIALILPLVPAARAREAGVYETSIKDGRLTQVAAGDLNHDGRTDLAVIETKDHFVEILTFGPDDGLVRANKFRVFAKKQFSRRRRDTAEPRWITLADLTNDGHDD
ncbi:MAG: VCBS repeat-containing protein, partial [bacterium]|nr:VCBS repeat-containing protein [bacterium]